MHLAGQFEAKVLKFSPPTEPYCFYFRSRFYFDGLEDFDGFGKRGTKMDFFDSDLPGQLVLVGLVVLACAAFFFRTVLFFRLEVAGIKPLYPDSWKDAQRRGIERFRMVIGLSLVPIWLAYLSLTPLIPKNWRLELILLISMLLVSYAWTVLLASRNWRQLDKFPRSYLLVIVFLLLWWGTAFSAIGWMLTEASARPSIHIIPPGVYAAREMPRLVE